MASTVWSGQLTFGLVSIPIQLVTAARRKTVNLNMLHAEDHSPVRQVIYCKTEDKPIERSEIVKGFEYEKGQYVEIEPEELSQITPSTASTMEILEFIRADDVDPLYLDTSYYVLPGDGGEKPYTLLYIAMHQTKYYAIAKVTMHRREHTVLIRCGDRGLVLHTMYYRDELQDVHAFRTEPTTIGQKELQLAKTLVDNLAAEFEPEKYEDTYRKQLEALIEAKIKGRKVVTAPETKAVAPVTDILEALQRSISQKQQPQIKAPRKKPKRASANASAKRKTG